MILCLYVDIGLLEYEMLMLDVYIYIEYVDII